MDKVFVFVSEDYLMKKIFSNALFEAKERESAVSPVVGVMLMLVVTIIIAATVSAFAGGLVGTTSKAPQAAFDVKITTHLVDGSKWGEGVGNSPTMVITHLGGDNLDTARTKIITTWTNRTTKEVYYRETTALPASDVPYEYDTGKYVDLDMANVDVNNTYSKYQEPYFVIPGILPGKRPDLWYGNFLLHPGDVMKVQGSLSDVSSSYNKLGYETTSLIKEAMLLTEQDAVNVKFVDIPTGQIIFSKDINVVKLADEVW